MAIDCTQSTREGGKGMEVIKKMWKPWPHSPRDLLLPLERLKPTWKITRVHIWHTHSHFYLGEIYPTPCSPLTRCIQVSPWLQGNLEDRNWWNQQTQGSAPTGFTGGIQDLLILGEAPIQDRAGCYWLSPRSLVNPAQRDSFFNILFL